jgi:D-glycero-beta-D-manno-heptose 1-phosphate adenylyltransferase
MSSHWENIAGKVVHHQDALACVNRWKSEGNEIVFTNGCFDILHYGHLRYLADARDLGSKLVVGLNSDASVKRLKGASRPINHESARAVQLASLSCIDLVVIFEEDTPLQLIELLSPDLLVKGGDYALNDIVGADWVTSHGGEVRALPYHEGFSTTEIISKIKSPSAK